MKKLKFRKINRAVHRDLGYFFFGMAIIYGISGIALNFRDVWNPNYIITQKQYVLALPEAAYEGQELSRFFILQIDKNVEYRTQISVGDELRIFVRGGTLTVDLATGNASLETVRRRPVFFEMNFLHHNTPQRLWTWFSSAFGLGLVFLAITGLFVLKGKNGITRRGAWITAAGILIPIIFLVVYLNGN